ncbi:MAG: 4Fe-4S dicluster domain-containing protein [Leptospiraceae bacterium]|nr:4Fe-4S dicluster domain-containing protein [Leptospiraceae bacterium]
MDRKKFFKDGLKSVLKIAKKTEEAKEEIPKIIHSIVKKKEEEYVPEVEIIQPKKRNFFKGLSFPPGAIKDKKSFEKTCTGCGDCISACPYDAIFPVYSSKANKSFPSIDPNFKPCLLCKDYPCINSCETGALVPLKKKQNPKFGKAKAIFEHCLNSKEEQVCSTCRNVCPIENVVSIKNGKPNFSNDCIGCGICVASCPSIPKAIIVK